MEVIRFCDEESWLRDRLNVAVLLREAGKPKRSIGLFLKVYEAAINLERPELYFDTLGQLAVVYKHLFQNTGENEYLERMYWMCVVQSVEAGNAGLKSQQATLVLRLGDALMLKGQSGQATYKYLEAWGILHGSNALPHTIFEYALHIHEACEEAGDRVGAGVWMDEATRRKGWFPQIPGWHRRVIMSKYNGLKGQFLYEAGIIYWPWAAVLLSVSIGTIIWLALVDKKPQRLNQLLGKLRQKFPWVSTFQVGT